MESFRFQGVEALEDCDASIEMCKLVNELSDVMNSRLPQTALRPNSKQIEVQKKFIFDRVSLLYAIPDRSENFSGY